MLKKILMKRKIEKKQIMKIKLKREIDRLSSHFGYSTFFKDPEIFQKSSDLSIPPSYIIGPGDEIIINVVG